MNTGKMIAAAALLASGAAFAQSVSVATDSVSKATTITRAQVRAELAQARAQGLLDQREHEYPITVTADLGARGPAGARASVRTGKTRAEVRKELETEGSYFDREEYRGQ